jgi:serine/threonine protein kinase
MNDATQGEVKREKFLPPGFVIDDRFEIKEPIRKTSGCIVYRVSDREVNVEKALLIIPPIIQVDFEAMDILRENTKTLKWLNHPYIARFYGLHSGGQFTYFEMEYFSGKSIKRKKYETPGKKFSENMAKWAALQILEGLSHAHNQNLLHRNIKPQKIIFTSNGQVRLIDFGISDAIRNAMAIVRDVTSQSAILFMPPEQIKGKRLSVQSDMYSLGATLYYLLEGRPPFYHGDIYYQILNEKPEPIEGISDEFNHILQICLAKDISDRYGNCDQMIGDLKGIRSRQEQATKTELTPEPVMKPEPPEEPVQKAEEEKTFRAEDMVEEFSEADHFFRNHFLEKIKANKPILLLTSLLLVIIIAGIVFNTFISSRTKSTTSTTIEANQTPQELTESHRKMIAALKNEAEKHFTADRLITPRGNNAYELYQEVLKIDPEDEQTLNRMEQLKSKLFKTIKTHISGGTIMEAENLLSACLGLFPDDRAFQNLEKELKQTLQQADAIPVNIEILNGAGVAGIARTMQSYLKQNNYKVVFSENYRKDGKIFWQVARSQFVGSIPKNKKIERLEKLLNIPYQRNELQDRQSKLANVLIILGKDYKLISAFE